LLSTERAGQLLRAGGKGGVLRRCSFRQLRLPVGDKPFTSGGATTMTEAHPTHELWTAFGHHLRGFIARRVENTADTDDILQEVFLRIHQRNDSVRQADRLDVWLYQITRNAIADHYRAPARRREVSAAAIVAPVAENLDAAVDGAATGDDAVLAQQAQRELATCLRPMVDRLPPTYCVTVVLADLEGLTQRETAEHLGLSFSGAKSRVQRGRRAIKAMLHDCCRIELDAGGRVTGYEAVPGSCASPTGSCQGPDGDGPACGSSAGHR